MPPRAGEPGGAPRRCPYYHEAVELLGRRWTGAIVEVLLQAGALRYSEIRDAVPDLSDRLLSQRLKDLEDRGLLARIEHAGPPPHARYELTPMGQALEPAVVELKAWGRRWLDIPAPTFRPG
jgi:DNA-binding HxlR family transcriptional regulator